MSEEAKRLVAAYYEAIRKPEGIIQAEDALLAYIERIERELDEAITDARDDAKLRSAAHALVKLRDTRLAELTRERDEARSKAEEWYVAATMSAERIARLEAENARLRAHVGEYETIALGMLLSANGFKAEHDAARKL